MLGELVWLGYCGLAIVVCVGDCRDCVVCRVVYGVGYRVFEAGM